MHREGAQQPPRSLANLLIGRPLATADAPHQTVRKIVGLAVFSSDAMSSVAYAPQEMMLVLATAGVAAFALSIPLAITIAILLLILTLSYEQTIHAYASGGGAYIVARDNLGELPALVAGAALLTDYILTVSVSISSGVAQITSAFPSLFHFRVEIAVALVLLVMLINLRGVKESGSIFAIPTYFFIVMMFISIGVGFYRYFAGSLGTVVTPPELEIHRTVLAITPFLILHAFSSGTTALTGVEAISNGIPAFREPKSRNAGITLIAMSALLGFMMLAITFLAVKTGAIPAESETVISQISRTVFANRGILYLGSIAATTVILIMAANTSFADFPRLSALVAQDGFLPRQLAFRGSRLVYSSGITLLAVSASVLIIVFQASVTSLIPLYAIGVFLSFTLSQAGMALRWRKSGKMQPGEEKKERGSILHYDSKWAVKMVINAFGAVCTTVVMFVFAITKFRDGAWVVLILIPLLVIILLTIHRHYRSLAQRLSLDRFGSSPPNARHRVILPLSGVHQGTLAALRYARNLSRDITAVHVSIDPEESQRVRAKWDTWGDGIRLVILDSPYRLLLEPLLDYIHEVAQYRQPNETITIVVPHFVPARRWHNLLHTQAASMLRNALLNEPGVVVTEVPYQVEDDTELKAPIAASQPAA